VNPSNIRQFLAGSNNESEVPEGTWKRAAVLVLILPGINGEEILFTRRTDTVLDHKGQVSFPGGAVELADANLEETALREGQEEVGLDVLAVDILGRSNDMFALTGWWITPIVGWYTKPAIFQANPTEVSRVFSIPLDWLAQNSNWEKRTYIIDDRIRENVIYYNQYQGELLWGVTAHMVHDLLKKLNMMD
jgi:8-oxo-dGTP pyrophosphatase MutT (NUDIX family)